MLMLAQQGVLAREVASWTPLDIPDVIGWYPTLQDSDATLVGSRVSIAHNRVADGMADLAQGTDANRPTWATIPRRIVFDADEQALDAGEALNAIFASLTAWTALVRLTITAATVSVPNSYENPAILFDGIQFWGLHSRGTSSPITLRGYVWDGADTFAAVSQDLGVEVTVAFWHDGVNLNVSVDDGAPVQEAAGAPTDGSGTFQVGSTIGALETAACRMEVRDVVVVDGVVSAADRTLYHDWVAFAYSLYDPNVLSLTPISYWKGDEISGSWTDEQGIQDGTIVNGPLIQADTIVDKDQGGQSAVFNGVDQYIQIAHAAALKTAEGSLLLTAQSRLLPGHTNIFAADDLQEAGGAVIEILADGRPRYYLRDNVGIAQFLTSTVKISLDRSYAFGMTWGANGFTAYLWRDDESLLWSGSIPSFTDGLSGTSEIRLGAYHNDTTFFDGVISRVVLVGSQLSQAQLETIAQPKTISGGELPLEPADPV